MTRALVIGDSHGNYSFIRNAVEHAVVSNVDLVIQLGDFGFWPAPPNVPFFSDRVHELAVAAGLPLLVIDGNHDWHEDYARWTDAEPSLTKAGLVHVPRGTILTIDRRSVGFLGGAVSIDMEHRMPGRSWWPEESLTDADVLRAMVNGHDIDVMLSHDAPLPPDLYPVSFSPGVEEHLAQQKRRFDSVLHQWKPHVHLHGHWHHRYSCTTPWGTRYGLDHEHIYTAILVFDFENLQVTP